MIPRVTGTRSALKRLAPLLKGEERILTGVLIYGVLTSVLSLVIPITVQSLVNSVAFGSLTQQLLILSSVVFVVLMFFGVLGSLQLLLAEKLQRRMFARIAIDLSQRIPRFSNNGILGLQGSEQLNPFLEVATVQKSLSHLLVSGLGVILQVCVGLVLLCLYHPLLLVFALFLFLSLFSIVFVLGRKGPETADAECSAKYRTLTWLEDLAEDKKYFRSQTGLTFAARRTNEVVEEWLGARSHHFRIVLMQYIGAYLVHALASSLLLGVGGWLVIQGQLTLGQLVAAELVVNTALSGFIKLGKHLESFYDLSAGLGKLNAFRMLGLEDTEGDIPVWNNGNACSVQLKNVSAGSRFDGSHFLSGLNLQVKAGERIAILGGNGSGKSLLCQVMFGLIVPDVGTVEVDKNDLLDVSLPKLRDKVAFVGDFRFFHGTLEENLTFGNPAIRRKTLRELVDKFGLAEKVSMFENGLASVMNPAHRVFSKGEMIRFAFIRALLREPGLLIIDQSLDSIDEQSLDRVFDVLLDAERDYTLLVTTHEPSIAARFPKRVILEDGEIKEEQVSSRNNDKKRGR